MSHASLARHPYMTVAAGIMDRIKTGELHSGDKLPSVRQLAKDHDVSPMTAQKALGHLVEIGSAESVPGLGYFVIGPAPVTDPVNVESLNEQVHELHEAINRLHSSVAALETRITQLESGQSA